MNVVTIAEKDVAARIDDALREKPDGILEMVAGKADASLWQVFQRLAEGQAVAIAGDRFEELWAGLTTWGTVLFIVHTEDIVRECEGATAGTSSTAISYSRRQPRRHIKGQQGTARFCGRPFQEGGSFILCSSERRGHACQVLCS